MTVYGTPVGLRPLTFGIQARAVVVHQNGPTSGFPCAPTITRASDSALVTVRGRVHHGGSGVPGKPYTSHPLSLRSPLNDLVPDRLHLIRLGIQNGSDTRGDAFAGPPLKLTPIVPPRYDALRMIYFVNWYILLFTQRMQGQPFRRIIRRKKSARGLMEDYWERERVRRDRHDGAGYPMGRHPEGGSGAGVAAFHPALRQTLSTVCPASHPGP